ncbi:MAG: glycosyltransferase family 39 protein, partial [Anaerolineales bacterium]|nr:glycosyltransferase family 39 protein [Anaerolineales bacterium]
ILPQFTTYNFADIPFAYPPFGFYIAAALSDLLPVSELWVLLYLPALINTISILFFYKFAEQTLGSRMSAALAVLVFALSPRSFLWQVMGGGITRSFGVLFLLLFLCKAVQLFKNYSHKELILAILFGAGAVLSHPQTAFHAVLGGALIFIFYGFSKRGFISAFFIGLGVALVTTPWWFTVLARYGLQPFISAGQTSQRTLEAYLGILKFNGLGDYLFIPTLLFAFIGVWISYKQREFFLIIWAVLATIVDPRGGAGIAFLALSMLAGMGLLNFLAWISRSDNEQVDAVFMKPKVQILLFGLIFYFVLVAGISDFQLVNTSLKADDLAMIDWVMSNVDSEKTFLLATGHEFSMSDPLQEWFPALANQYSATTLQGLEWTLGDGFLPWHQQLTAFQHCADVNCISGWSARNRVDYHYLIVTIPPGSDESDLAVSLRSLATSTRSSALHLLVYESENALVFELSQ